MATSKMWLNGTLQGTENDLVVNLEMRGTGEIYWVPGAGAMKKVSGIEAIASPTENQALVLKLNMAENGGSPVVQKIIGYAVQDGAETSASWSYVGAGGMELEFGLPANGPTGQVREAQWDCMTYGAPAVDLKVIVRRTAP